MEKIVLVGAGGHAKTIVDTLERSKEYEIAGFIAPQNIAEKVYRGYRILGHDEDMEAIFTTGIFNAIIAIGFIGKSDLRNRIYKEMKKIGFRFPVIKDLTAMVANDVKIGEGSYIGRNVVINAEGKVGKNCIVNTGAIIEHECVMGDFSHLSVASVLCGQASVGTNVFIGANATVLQQKRVGNECVIGAGAVVTENIPDGSTAVGIPARVICG